MRLYTDEQVSGFLRDDWWTGETWLDLLERHVRERGELTSVVDPINCDAICGRPPRRLTWVDVDHEVYQLARSLYRAGIRKDDLVGVQLHNSAELAITYLAVASLGAVTCSFPVQYAQHELTQMGTMAGLRAFVTVGRV